MKIPSGCEQSSKIAAILRRCVQTPKTQIKDTDTRGLSHPAAPNGPGKAVDITIPVEEGEQYRLGGITFKNNKAITNTKGLRGLFPIKDGDIFDRDKVAKGLENLRKAYANRLHQLYVRFRTPPDEAKKLIDFRY